MKIYNGKELRKYRSNSRCIQDFISMGELISDLVDLIGLAAGRNMAKKLDSFLNSSQDLTISLADFVTKNKNGTLKNSDISNLLYTTSTTLAKFCILIGKKHPAIFAAVGFFGAVNYITEQTERKELANEKFVSDLMDSILSEYPNVDGMYGPDSSLILGFICPLDGPGKGDSENIISPIVIDLDRDGIETTSVRDGVFFDHNNDGFSERSAWVSPDDGLLVLDKNGNGIIDSGGELFGNNSELNNGTLAKNGYEALKEFDINKDNIIDAKDSIWEDLKIWKDVNSDAKTNSSELLSMEEAEIKSISLNYRNSNHIDQYENKHKQVSSVIYSDGAEGVSTDVWFNISPEYVINMEDIEVPDSIYNLPYVRGFGLLPDLHTALAKDHELIELLNEIIMNNDYSENKIKSLLYKWGEVENIVPESRGKYMDARTLHLLEKTSGSPYHNNTNGTSNPLGNAAKELNSQFDDFMAHVAALLMAQTTFKKYFCLIQPEFNVRNLSVAYIMQDFCNVVTALKYEDVKLYSALRSVFYYASIYLPFTDKYMESLHLPPLKSIVGFGKNATLEGGSKNDFLYGGTGNDRLDGGAGNDIYLFNRGDGRDVINNYDSAANRTDRLVFGSGIRPEDVNILRSGNDLYLRLAGGEDEVRILSYLSSDGLSHYRLDLICFEDGTQWDIETVKYKLSSN